MNGRYLRRRLANGIALTFSVVLTAFALFFLACLSSPRGFPIMFNRR